MKAFLAFVADLIVKLFLWIIGRMKPKASDAAPKGALEEKLKDKIKKDGWKVVLLFLLLPGCAGFTRTVYVPDGKAVRVRKEIRNAKVWVTEADGNVVEGAVDIKEGWFCLPSP